MMVCERRAGTAEAAEEKTRDKILDAAGEVFAEHGFEGATIRAITERAGANVAAVNYHFRDKSDPTEALDLLVEKNIRPFREEFLMPVLNELAGGRCTQRQLGLLSASVMSQCLYYLQCQPMIERLVPDFKIADAEIDEIAEHISQFSLAAIAGLDRRARQS
jgi:AcrR family transcriptional regulator